MSAQEGTDQDIGNVVVDQLAVGFFAQDNKRLAKRSEATAGTEWLYAHSAGADFVRRGDNVKNKKRLWLSRSLPPSADRLRRFPRALPAGLGGSPALLAPGFRVSAWNQVWNQAPFLGAGFRSRFRGICSRSRGSGPVSHGPFLTARFSGLVRQGILIY